MIRPPVFSDIPKSAYNVETASYVTSIQLGIDVDMVYFNVDGGWGIGFSKYFYSISNHIANL